jgi:hypothetical protein
MILLYFTSMAEGRIKLAALEGLEPKSQDAPRRECLPCGFAQRTCCVESLTYRVNSEHGIPVASTWRAYAQDLPLAALSWLLADCGSHQQLRAVPAATGVEKVPLFARIWRRWLKRHWQLLTRGFRAALALRKCADRMRRITLLAAS